MLRAIWRSLTLVAILVGANVPSALAQGEGEAEKLAPRAVVRLGSTAFAQDDIIYAVALAPDGKIAATAGRGEFSRDAQGKPQWDYDRLTIRLWDIPTGKPTRQILVADGPVLTLDFSPDGKTLAAGVGNKIVMWNVAAGKESLRLPFEHEVSQARFAADGKHLLINLFNKKTVDWEIVQWNLEERTRKVLWNSKDIGENLYIRDLDLAPDGTRIAMVIAKYPEYKKGMPVVETPPHRLQVLALPSGKELFAIDGKEVSYAVALSPDKKTVTFGVDRLASWDISSNKKRREFAGVPSMPAPPPDASVPSFAPPVVLSRKEWRTLTLIAYSPNGKLIATACWPNYVSLWNAESGAKIGDYLHTPRRTPYQASDALLFSRDSKTLAFGGSYVLRLIDTSSGKEISSWPGHRAPLTSFSFSPDGQSLYTHNDAEFCAWQAGTWQLRTRLDLLPLQKKSVVAHSWEKSLLITWKKGEFFLEDLPSGKVLATFPTKGRAFDSGAFSYQGETCCLQFHGAKGDFSAVFYSVPDCKELFQLKLQSVQSGYFSPVHNAFGWTDKDGIRFEADGITGKVAKKLDLRGKSFEPDGPPPINLGSVFSWDNKYLLTQAADAKGQAVRIWDVEAGRTTHRLLFPLNHTIRGIDFAFDSRLMVYTQAGRNGICVLELASGKERRSLLAPGQTNPNRVVTSPTDFVVAAGLPGNTVLVWDLARPGRKLTKAALTDQQLDALWTNLADANAIKAESAIESLVQHPAQAVPLLRARLKAVPPLDSKRVARLIADLGKDDVSTQKKATTELSEVLELAEPALRQALEKSKATAEVRRRMEEILAQPLAPPSAETLRGIRALETLEKIATREARAAIEPIARGAPGARVTQDASATMKRLERRK